MDKNLKILVVDDFSTMRRILRNLLADFGHADVTAATLKEKIGRIFQRIAEAA